MDGRLEGKNVAVVFLGPVDGSVRADVEGALADADGGAPARVVALDVPVDPADSTAILEGDELLAAYADEGGDLSDLGRELGRELAEGDDTLWASLQSELIEEQSGSTSAPIDAAVVVTTWMPPEDAGAGGEPDPGAESTATPAPGSRERARQPGHPRRRGGRPATIGSSRSRRTATAGSRASTTSSCRPGRLALALLLAGAEPGHYGFGESATDGVRPSDRSLAGRG